MKGLLTIILLLYVIGNVCAQISKTDTDRTQMEVLLFTKTKVLDSIINVAIRGCGEANPNFAIRLLPGKEHDLVQIYFVGQKGLAYVLKPDFKDHEVWGYCQYNNSTIFLVGDKSDPRKFFSITDKQNEFHFIWYNRILSTRKLLNIHSYSEFYSYKNGKFHHGIVQAY